MRARAVTLAITQTVRILTISGATTQIHKVAFCRNGANKLFRTISAGTTQIQKVSRTISAVTTLIPIHFRTSPVGMA